MSTRIDIFDHLVGEAGDQFLRERAREMYRSPMWRSVSVWTKPEDVSGEIAQREGGAR